MRELTYILYLFLFQEVMDKNTLVSRCIVMDKTQTSETSCKSTFFIVIIAFTFDHTPFLCDCLAIWFANLNNVSIAVEKYCMQNFCLASNSFGNDQFCLVFSQPDFKIISQKLLAYCPL